MQSDPELLKSSRRKFLAQCGKFAVVTPPTITLMLVAAEQNFAVAASGGTVGGVIGGGAGGGILGSLGSTGGGAGAGGGGAGGEVASLSSAGGGAGGGGESASFAPLGGGGGSGGSLGIAAIPPECEAIKDPAERAICVEEYAKGLKRKEDDKGPRDSTVENAALSRR